MLESGVLKSPYKGGSIAAVALASQQTAGRATGRSNGDWRGILWNPLLKFGESVGRSQNLHLEKTFVPVSGPGNISASMCFRKNRAVSLVNSSTLNHPSQLIR